MLKLPATPHITALYADNVKSLRAVRITPEGHLVQITGPNESGKSSVLDAILWALGGTKSITDQPIRRGEDSATIQLSLGAVTVTRTFYIDDAGEQKSRITVKSVDGATYPTPQRLLDDLVGTLTFDPMTFDRMPAKDRLGVLRALVPLPIDLDEMGRLDASDYSARTEVGREVKRVEGVVATLGAPEEAPEGPVDVAPLVERMAGASKANAARAEEEAVRARMVQEIEASYAAAEAKRAEAARLMAEAGDCVVRAAEQAARLEALPPLPEVVDTAALTAEMERVRTINAAVARNAERAARRAEVAGLEEQVALLTNRMAERERVRSEALAAAQMPVPGLSFGDGDILVDGLPYAQASTGRRIRVCMGIGMAANPSLRVLLIREGALLDTGARALVAEIAAEHDYQVWMELVDESGDVGIVLYEGAVVKVNP